MKKCDIIIKLYAAVVELADAPDSKSGGSDTVTVRPRPAAPCRSKLYIACSDFCLQKSERGNMSLLLFFRKRSHSRRLLGCKCPRNAFGSLPTKISDTLMCIRYFFNHLFSAAFLKIYSRSNFVGTDYIPEIIRTSVYSRFSF